MVPREMKQQRRDHPKNDARDKKGEHSLQFFFLSGREFHGIIVFRPQYSDYLTINVYCSITFPSRYTANPRRPLFRVIPPEDATAVS